MDPTTQSCPHEGCRDQGKVGAGNIGVHSRKEGRYMCHTCKKTFAATTGTMFYRLQYDHEFVSQIITLLAHGCPPEAIVAAFGVDERTMDRWWDGAESHCRQVHEQEVQQGQLDLGQVQADEIRGKIQGAIVWVAMAIAVPTRLWLGGVVSETRDQTLLDTLATQVRACALCRPLLICFDGLAGYAKAFYRAFRTPLRLGQVGRPPLIPWPDVALGQVVKQYSQGRVTGVKRTILRGSEPLVHRLLETTQGGGVLNTAYIERLNGTFRARLAPLARRTRALARLPETIEGGMFVVGCVYNFCTYHQSLREPLYLGWCPTYAINGGGCNARRLWLLV